MEKITLGNLSFSYPTESDNAISNVSLSLASGELVLICGPSGSGKSTLLRLLKPAIAPHGKTDGEILIDGKSISELTLREQTEKIGFVSQSVDNQLVTDKVWHELAFGLENLGLKNDEIRRRVAETAAYFGVEDYFEKNTDELSGGQKQILNLASVMITQPEILLLDEPTSQLDPIAAGDFISLIKKINIEFGTTVLISEHRTNELFPLCDRAVVLDGGKIVADGAPREAALSLLKGNSELFSEMPSALRLWCEIEPNENKCPLTTAEGRGWLRSFSERHTLRELYPEETRNYGNEIISLKRLWFRYSKNSPDVIKDLNLSINKGEIFALLGGNGAGKSTLLSIINGANAPYKGRAEVREKCVTLPQNPLLILNGKTVYDSLSDALDGEKVSKAEKEARIGGAASLCSLDRLLNRHPYDLSGGEQQLAAIAKLILNNPEILLLDEPTKGLDANKKETLSSILRALSESGITVLIISHDAEFCAEIADRCAMMFNGEITSEGTPREFFGSNSFYVTPPARISRGITDTAVTHEEVVYCCTGKRKDKKRIDAKTFLAQKKIGEHVNSKARNFLRFDLPEEKSGNGFSKNKLPKRTVLALILILSAIPLTIFVGATYLKDQKYLFISLLVMLECMLPFFIAFEGRKPKAREAVIIAVLCAIAIAGRLAFFALPQIKPLLAVVIISGAAFGAESGFLVGAVSMLVSNIYFGQGAWTPWQMFAAGLIGFLAGILFKRSVISHGKIPLCIFGFLSALVLYGGIMNLSTAVLAHAPINLSTIIAYLAQGFPLDLIHAASTLIVLFFISKPMLEKLSRIKIKYGI